MSTLARRLGLVLPTEAASPPAWRRPEPEPTLREILGEGRLSAAVEHGDWDRVGELVALLLDYSPGLAREVARQVHVRTSHALAALPLSEGTTP